MIELPDLLAVLQRRWAGLGVDQRILQARNHAFPLCASEVAYEKCAGRPIAICARLSDMPLMRCVTADLVDAFSDQLSVCLTQFRQFGGRSSFCGPIRTIKTLEDNADVKSYLSTPGDGAVLVIDGGGSLRTALLGDMLATLAVENGWAGIVVLGAVRDSVQLGRLPLGIKALGTVPAKSAKNGGATIDAAVEFGGVTFQPGHWLYSDEDGLLVAAAALHQV